jgi:redox-sensitive bicupin YhaK (pirin superfamily)
MQPEPRLPAVASEVILGMKPLGFPWETPNPFLFCVFHDDRYPRANEGQGPAASLEGRQLGQDFAGKDGWRMYHGQEVPGFPQHPHRGFETVTIVRRGLIDHSDSLGATARYGGGDVQWLTAGKGILHSEMFPLIDRSAPNPLELFQIWLNLPRADKLAPPYFAMLWNENVPRVTERDAAGRSTEITVVAGELAGVKAQPPAPRSWAARPDTDVAIWTLKLAPGATWTLPPAHPGSNRRLYFFRGSSLKIAGTKVALNHSVDLLATATVKLENGDAEAELLLLQGKPIDEPVVQYGPFVMNSQAEIAQTIREYQQTGFGSWSFASDGPVQPREAGRFARRPDGTEERPPRR